MRGEARGGGDEGGEWWCSGGCVRKKGSSSWVYRHVLVVHVFLMVCEHLYRCGWQYRKRGKAQRTWFSCHETEDETRNNNYDDDGGDGLIRQHVSSKGSTTLMSDF